MTSGSVEVGMAGLADGLRHSRVVIVGGGSGIGLGAADLLSRVGAEVTIAGRNAGRLEAAASALDGRVAAEPVDAVSRASCEALFERIGAFDHLILTVTGRLGGGEFASLPLDDLRKAFDEKFWAHLTAAQASLKTLAKNGSLTFVTGVSARRVNPGGAGFGAINGALEIMTPTLARELAPRRVNAVSPGLIATPWYDFIPEDERRAIYEAAASRLPVGRVGASADVAQALFYVLATPFVTGSVIECDGGARLIEG